VPRIASRFWSYTASRKLLFLEAFVVSTIAKLMLFGLPFRIIQKVFGFKAYQANIPFSENSNTNLYQYGVLQTVKIVFQTVDSISRHVFWTNTCLVRSITVKYLLRRRKINALLYLGLAKDEQGQLKAHAWVKVPEIGLVYDDGSGEYTTVAVLV
jgi:ABC-type long-subunit fatty acid transport system fused permease/ATPase subunit